MSKPEQPARAESATPGKRRPLAFVAQAAGHAAAWVLRHPFPALVAALLVLLVVMPVSILILGRRAPESIRRSGPTAAAALECLDAGDIEGALEIVDEVEHAGELGDDSGLVPLVRGIASAVTGADLLGDARRDAYSKAADLLSSADGLGVPDQWRPALTYQLGKSLFLSGKPVQSIPFLESALDRQPDLAGEIRQYLMQALAASEPSRREHAIEYSRAVQSDRTLSTEERDAAVLLECDLLLRSGDWEASQSTLARLQNAQSAAAKLILGRFKLAEAGITPGPGSLAGAPANMPDEAVQQTRPSREDQLHQGLEYLEEAQRGSSGDDDTQSQAMYLAGVCELALGEDESGRERLARALKLFPQSSAGIAAGVLLARAQRELEDFAGVLSTWQGLLAELPSVETHSGPWVKPSDIEAELLNAYQAFLGADRLDDAVHLAGMSANLLTAQRAQLLIAGAFQRQGSKVLDSATALPGAQSEALSADGRKLLRRAGREFSKLAEMRILTRSYPDDLWNAADSFRLGRDYRASAPRYRQYLDAELRRRRPEALVGLAVSLAAIGQLDAGLAAARECIEFHPRDARVFEARLLAAQICVEQGNTELAQEFLLENLNGDLLTPASREWRDSLFALGRLLFDEGLYRDAISHLEHAVERYPTVWAALDARYYLSEAYRKLAIEVDLRAQSEATLEERLARQREVDRLNTLALGHSDEILSALLEQEETGALAPLHAVILRNSYFAKGSSLYGLGRYLEAIAAYAAALNRYQEAPEVLDAYVQIAACYRQLGQDSEAKSAIEQAKVALRRLGEQAEFERTTNYTVDEWTRLLESLEKL